MTMIERRVLINVACQFVSLSSGGCIAIALALANAPSIYLSLEPESANKIWNFIRPIEPSAN